MAVLNEVYDEFKRDFPVPVGTQVPAQYLVGRLQIDS
jgi:hypothetical protein